VEFYRVRVVVIEGIPDLGVLTRTVGYVEGSVASNSYARRIMEEAHYKVVE